MKELDIYSKSKIEVNKIVNYYNRYIENMDLLFSMADLSLSNADAKIYAEYSNTNIAKAIYELDWYGKKRDGYIKELKKACFRALFERTGVIKFMNAEQKRDFTKNINLVSENIELTENSCYELLDSYKDNFYKTLYESISYIAGRITSRKSEHKTNSKAYMFENKHILKNIFRSDLENNWINSHNAEIMVDLFKMHDLIYPEKININSYFGFDNFKDGEHIKIKRFKNGNGHILLSDDFKNKLNSMIKKNVLK